MSMPPVVWTIAGFDPSSGAGITADLKTMASHDCYGVACITALTVQNTQGVRRVEPVSRQIVRETLQALLDDMPPRAVKIGMLCNVGIVGVVADLLEKLQQPRCPIILDPILRSSSGAELLDAAAMELLRDRLLPLATVVTPNRGEAAQLTGLPIEDVEAMAKALRKLGAAAAVVTGGDASEGEGNSGTQFSRDVLAYSLGGLELIETLSAPRIRSTNTHGTGCAFSTAITCAMACGQNVPTAVSSAKAFVRLAIGRAPALGKGCGPMGLDRQ